MYKQSLYNIFTSFYFDRLLHSIRSAPAVLFFHGVAEKPNPFIETESVSVMDFVRQMKYLKKFYHVVSIREFEERYNLNKWEGDEVLLTFDDGYKNMLSTALPILEEFNFPFVLFLTTKNIDQGELFSTTVNRLVVLASSIKHLQLHSCNINISLTTQNRTEIASFISKQLKSRSLPEVQNIVKELYSNISKDEMNNLRERYSSVNPMNWQEVNQFASSPLCTIGSHGIDHICCHENQNLVDVSSQIHESKRIIEEKLGVCCDYFSYPNGSFTEQSNSIVAEANYRLGFSTKRLPIHALTKWNIPRLYVPYNYSKFVYSITTYPN